MNNHVVFKECAMQPNESSNKNSLNEVSSGTRFKNILKYILSMNERGIKPLIEQIKIILSLKTRRIQVQIFNFEAFAVATFEIHSFPLFFVLMISSLRIDYFKHRELYRKQSISSQNSFWICDISTLFRP